MTYLNATSEYIKRVSMENTKYQPVPPKMTVAAPRHHAGTGHLTPVVLLSTLIVAGLVWFPAGYSVVQINIPQSLILGWIRHTECGRLGQPVVEYSNSSVIDVSAYMWCKIIPENETSLELRQNGRLNVIWALIGSTIMFGSATGVWIANYLISLLGFRKIFLLSSGLQIAGIILSGVSQAAASYEILIVGRIILGFAVGFGSAACGVFIAEISPTNLRGALGVVNIVLFSTAMLLAAVLGLPQALGTADHWAHLSWIMLLPNVTFLLSFRYLPESPRWYFRITHNVTETSKILQRLRGSKANVEEEVQLIAQEERAAKNHGATRTSIRGLFRERFLRHNIIVCVTATCAQRLTAYAAVYSYSTDIFRQCGLPKEIASYGTIGLLLLQLLFAVVGSFLVDRIGRRTLLLFGLFGCISTLASMVLFAALTKYAGCVRCQYGNLTVLFLFIMFYTTGPGSVPFVLVSEMFGLTSRQSATTLILILNAAVSAAVAAVFPAMQSVLQEWTFMVFAGIVALLTVYLCVSLVETKGKTFLEIQEILEECYYRGKRQRTIQALRKQSLSKSHLNKESESPT